MFKSKQTIKNNKSWKTCMGFQFPKLLNLINKHIQKFGIQNLHFNSQYDSHKPRNQEHASKQTLKAYSCF